MAVSNLVKRIQDIMRNDAGVDGDAQRISQMTWMFFLKVYDAKEEEWEFFDENYKSLIPDELKWRNWAIDDKSNNVITGEKLLDLVNNKVFPTLKNLEINEDTPLKQRIVRYVFEDAQNYIDNAKACGLKTIGIEHEFNRGNITADYVVQGEFETVAKDNAVTEQEL